MVVYLVTNRVNGMHYVGKTTGGLKKRWTEHVSKAGRGVQTRLYSAIRKYGVEVFSIVPLSNILSNDPQLKEHERSWIRFLRSNERKFGYNLTDGGEGSEGLKHSENARRKMSASHTGKPLSESHRRNLSVALKGKPHHPLSAEHKRKISAALKGKKIAPRSAEHSRKIGETKRGNTYRKGKAHSAEARKKMSAALTGRILSPESVRKRSLTRFLKTVAWG